MFSQNNEEEIILNHFKDWTGIFVDIGAFDGVTFSNTRALLQRGWVGYHVEPSPSVLPALKENLSEFWSSAVLIDAAVTPSFDGAIQLHDCGGDAVSTTVEAHRQKWSKHATYDIVTVKAISVQTLLEQTGFGFHFLNIDVEGGNLDLLLAMPISKLTNLQMICIEHDGHYQAITNHLSPHGFTEVLRNPENLIFARNATA